MINQAFRKIFLILVEKIARLETIYEEKINADNGTNIKFLNCCRQSLAEIKGDLLKNRQVLMKSYGDETLSLNEINQALYSIDSVLIGFLDLHSLLGYLPSNQVMPETFIFLDKTIKTQEKLSVIDERIVLLAPGYLARNTRSCLSFFLEFEKYLDLYIPIMESSNPLYWVLLIKNVFTNLDKLNINIEEKINKFISSEANTKNINMLQKLAFELVSDLFAIKTVGPAYFYFMIEQGVFRSIAESGNRFLPTLAIREKLIYNELKKLGLAENLENTHKWFISIAELSDNLSNTLGFKTELYGKDTFLNDLVDKLDGEINSILSEESLFNYSDLNNSTDLFEQLDKEVAGSVYTPQQVINAGWIYKENSSDKIFKDLLNDNSSDFSTLALQLNKLNNTLINILKQ